MIYLTLFWEFFKIGLFSIGGGLATLPFLYDLASKYDWFTTADLANMIAISEATPGPIGVNMSTYVGFQTLSRDGLGLQSVFGAFTTTFALVLPSVVIIVIIAKFLDKFSDSKYVKGAFEMLRPVVAGLIFAACFEIYKVAFLNIDLIGEVGKNIFDVINIYNILIFGIILFGVMKFKKHPVVYILLGGIVGFIFGL